MPTYIGNQLYSDIRVGTQLISDVIQPKPPFVAEYLVVASGNFGGSGTGSPTRKGGGGGAGGLLSGSVTIIPNFVYQIQVGSFDANDISYSSYLTGSNFYNVATGGGNGGDTAQSGQNGGSGGGAGALAGVGGSGIAGQGNNGAGFVSSTLGGGGGGAGSAASGATGGSGLASSISGTSVTYSKGGNSDGAANGVNFGDGSGGGVGGGGVANNPGTPKEGVVILRYLGPQKFEGGTVTTDGNFIIHTFTTTPNGTLGAAYTRYSFVY